MNCVTPRGQWMWTALSDFTLSAAVGGTPISERGPKEIPKIGIHVG